MTLEHVAIGTPRSALVTGFVALDVLHVDGAARGSRYRAGGTAGNVAAILGALGWGTTIAGPRRGSLVSNLAVGDFERCGAVYHELYDQDFPVVVEHLQRGESHRFSFSCPTCGHGFPTFRRSTSPLPELASLLQGRDVFFVDRLFPGVVEAAFAARERGTVVVYEPSDPADQPWSAEMLATADIVKYSSDREKKMPWLTDGSDSLVVRTEGAKGAAWRWRDISVEDWRTLPASPAANVVDTCGAGDWMTAGLLMGMFELMSAHRQGISPQEVDREVLAAQKLASWSCRFAGARGALYEAGAREALRHLSGDRSLVSAVDSHALVEPVEAIESCVVCTGA
ncbi:MAG: PfkB family carbohydrate kinase [Lacipirellulaceae bacterium]